jgi:hypothetical protein
VYAYAPGSDIFTDKRECVDEKFFSPGAPANIPSGDGLYSFNLEQE